MVPLQRYILFNINCLLPFIRVITVQINTIRILRLLRIGAIYRKSIMVNSMKSKGSRGMFWRREHSGRCLQIWRSRMVSRYLTSIRNLANLRFLHFHAINIQYGQEPTVDFQQLVSYPWRALAGTSLLKAFCISNAFKEEVERKSNISSIRTREKRRFIAKHCQFIPWRDTKLIDSWLRDRFGYLAPCLLSGCNTILDAKL